jgi:hypothetical protein
MKERTCKGCGAKIGKGDLYGQRSRSVSLQESINEGRDWRPIRISVKSDICSECA